MLMKASGLALSRIRLIALSLTDSATSASRTRQLSSPMCEALAPALTLHSISVRVTKGGAPSQPSTHARPIKWTFDSLAMRSPRRKSASPSTSSKKRSAPATELSWNG
eukprot:6172020-Pleurochrysis_carterae.AAC.3